MPVSIQSTATTTQFTGVADAGLLLDPTGGDENSATEIYFLSYHDAGTAPAFTVSLENTTTPANAPVILTGTGNDLADLVGKRIPAGFNLKFVTTGKDATGYLTIGYRVVAEG